MTDFQCNLTTVIQELQETLSSLKPKAARVYATIPQTIGGTETYLNFDKISFDTGNFFAVNDPSKFVCKEPGIYRLSTIVRFRHELNIVTYPTEDFSVCFSVEKISD